MNKLFLLLVVFTVFSCQNSKNKTKIIGADWILGAWENKSDEGTLIESWKKLNDSVFVGESYFINEKDTLHSEQMQLKQKGENLFYISNIKGQNSDKPVTFAQNTEIENQLVFENPTNQHPRKISYKPTGKDQITIQVSGIQQRKSSLDTYEMKKK
jgi:Domain of unknown function (DUF6265)